MRYLIVLLLLASCSSPIKEVVVCFSNNASPSEYSTATVDTEKHTYLVTPAIPATVHYTQSIFVAASMKMVVGTKVMWVTKEFDLSPTDTVFIDRLFKESL